MSSIGGAIHTIGEYLDKVGIRLFLSGTDTTEKAVEKELIISTVPVSTIRYLRQFDGSTSVVGIFRIYQNTEIIGTKRTAPGKPNVALKWDPYRPIPSGDSIRVTFEASRLTGSDVEAYLSSSDIT